MNTKVATLVPKAHLIDINGDEYFMALSYAATDPEYVNFFATQARIGNYVILDNSAVELGHPEPFEDYLAKAFKMGVSEVMLPDFFQDAQATVAEARRCMSILSEQRYGGNIMVIPQGKTVLEWIECCKALLDIRVQFAGSHRYLAATTVGISTRYTDFFDGSRAKILWLLELALFGGQKVHFLGCYADPRMEIAPVLPLHYVRGVDSSYPSVYAQQGMLLTPEAFSWPRPPRNIDFLNDKYDRTLLRANITEWRDACQSQSS